MLEAFRAHCERTGLLPDGVRVVLGYSGGADSTCLLHLLREAGADVVAAHLHHGQRTEADDEERRCAELAESIGVPFASGRADVPRMAADLGVGLEEAGREARYEFLERVRRQTGAALVVTAHTLDDHVETVLLNLARGTGLTGLAGIPARRGSVVRPLLFARRRQTRAYCSERGLWFHDDPANGDLAFSRARVRLRIVPELEALNPGFAEAVARTASIAEAEDRFLNGMAAAALERSESPLNGELRFLTYDSEVAFDLSRLGREPEVLVARGVRLAASALGADLDHRATTEVVAGVRSGERGATTAPGGLVTLVWDGQTLHAARRVKAFPSRSVLTVPGETESLEFGWRFLVEPSAPKPGPGGLAETIDFGALKGPLHIRTAQPGDRIDPLGLGGTKKLADVFREGRLTESARRLLPILCDMVGPVWVPGLALADRVRIRAGTARALRVAFGPLRPRFGQAQGTALPSET